MEPLLFKGREHAVLEAKTLYVQCSQLGGGIVYGLRARQHKSNLNTCINQAVSWETHAPNIQWPAEPIKGNPADV
eukprot:2727725-Amphidinium_carterae.1